MRASGAIRGVGAPPGSRWRVGLLVIVLVAPPPVRLWAQSLTVSAVGDTLHVKAPGFHFVDGEALDHLKSGGSVRFDFDLAVLARPGGPAVAQTRQRFNLSYDLWEERFAVARIGTPARSATHLSQADAESWCLEQLIVPVSAFAALGRGAPFWIKLAYRVVDRNPPEPGVDETFTLRGLIDRLSRRRTARTLGDSVEAGPFRLSN